MAEFETVLRTPELGPGAMMAVEAHGREIVVANVGQTYYAVDASCPVDGANLAREGRLEDDVLICPHDGARFSVRTGERLDGGDGLRAHAVRIEGNEIKVGSADYADRNAR
ncbi:MAG: nitrite reductase (NAD(P)H) small subunit [Gemmatimonadetes bacterium]|nr:nitrite reductase (NAD(P)H) small subunit [Gemmatimonadota bacterium]